MCFSLLYAVVSFVLAPQLIHIFIRGTETIRYGADFLRICCIAIPIYSVTFVIIAVFQAAGFPANTRSVKASATYWIIVVPSLSFVF